MADKIYTLESSVLSYKLGFEGEVIYCELIRRLKECQLSQVVKVIQKPTSLGSGEEISFRIIFLENGKEKKFPWVQASITNVSTKEFLEDLKGRLGPQVIWEDKSSRKIKSEEGKNVYDLQYLPLGYSGAGLSRGVQIWIYTICFGLLVLPLLYFIPLLIKGGYRIYTDDMGLEIRKFGSKIFTWPSISNVTITNVTVKDRDNYSTTKVMKLSFTVDQKSRNVVMRYDHAIPLLKEMAEREIISAELIEDYI